MIDNELKLADV